MSEALGTAAVVEESASTLQRVLAELVGTWALVFIGCGVAMVSGGDLVATGLAFGLVVLVMVHAFGRVSGGHFNPAVSLGAAISGRLAWRDLPVYVGTQLLGGVLGGATLFVTMKGYPGFSTDSGFASNAFGDQSANNYAWWAALILELIMTMLFVMVILGSTDARNEHPGIAPIAIGLTLAIIHFASIPATGTSVNPARSLGVGIFAGADHALQLWLFFLAPLLGAALAGVVYPLIFGAPDVVEGSGLGLGRRGGPAMHTMDAYQQQWNAPAGQPAPFPPQQQPQAGQPWGQPQQGGWQHQQPQGAPAQQPPHAAPPPAYPPAPPAGGQQPQHFGQPTWPDADADGRTQIRPNE